MRYKLCEDAVLQGVWHVEAVDAESPSVTSTAFTGPMPSSAHEHISDVSAACNAPS